MAAILNALQGLAVYLVGGTWTPTGGTATTVEFADSLLGGIVTAVTDNPILLIFVILGIAFAGIGIFKRLTRG